MSNVLEVCDLRVKMPVIGSGALVEIVRGLTFAVENGGFHALVGESGCGKSLTAMALTRLPPTSGAIVSGSVRLRGEEILGLSEKRLRRIRKNAIAYVFQEPVAALNPVQKIGEQLREALGAPLFSGWRHQAISLLREVNLPEPERLLRMYPCQLSGGMAQRVMIAAALAQNPCLIVADEPTTALDVVSQRGVLELLSDRCKARGVAVLLITHNLALVSAWAQTMSVLYAGQIVEQGHVERVLRWPCHPYTKALLGAVPRMDGTNIDDLATIPGTVPPPSQWSSMRCVFKPRCRYSRQCSILNMEVLES